jgi:3-oxoacyl-[acyl-carrier protein] reductase
MLLSHAAIPLLKASGSGRIVNIGSRGGYRGEPGGPAYGSAKAGLHAGMQSMAQALAPAGIHVFSIAPGFVETDMVSEHLAGPAGDAIKAQSPLNRVAQPGEIARIVAFLLSGEGDWMTGSVLDANGASYLR